MEHQDVRIQQLIAACPAIKSRLDLSEGPNFIFCQVAVLLRDKLLDSETESQVYGFLNQLGEDDPETQNLLVVSVLEILGDTPDSIRRAKEKLAGNTRLLFERVVRGWQASRT